MHAAERPVDDESIDAVLDQAAHVTGKARRAIRWSILNTLVGKVGSTFVGIVLARVLLPDDYGVFAVALVVLNALLSVNELGVSLAVVRWPGDVARIAPTVVTISLLSSVVLWGVVFGLAPTIATAMNAPDATGVLRLLSLAVLIDAVTAVPAALLAREFLQKQQLAADLVGFVVTAGLSVGLATAGAGAWSLAVSALVGNLLNGLLIVRYSPRWFAPGFDRRVARELLSFGLPLALASLLVFALLNVDYVLVGAETSATMLGFYLLAFNLSTWPVTVFSAPARRVSAPAFARLAEGGTGASPAFVTACTAMVTATLPACLGLGLLAVPAVTLAYGDTWRPSAVILPWLMVLALTRTVGELAYDFLVAVNRTAATLLVQTLWVVALVPAALIGVRLDGIQGMAIAHAGICLVVALPAYGVVLARTGVNLRDLGRHLIRPLTGAALAGVLGWGATTLVSGRLAEIAAGGAVVLVVYGVAVYPMRRLFFPGRFPESAVA